MVRNLKCSSNLCRICFSVVFDFEIEEYDSGSEDEKRTGNRASVSSPILSRLCLDGFLQRKF